MTTVLKASALPKGLKQLTVTLFVGPDFTGSSVVSMQSTSGIIPTAGDTGCVEETMIVRRSTPVSAILPVTCTGVGNTLLKFIAPLQSPVNGLLDVPSHPIQKLNC